MNQHALLLLALAVPLMGCEASTADVSPAPGWHRPAVTPEYLPDFWSGTRLHATYDDAGSDVRAFTGFWDAQLGVKCEYPRARNGIEIARTADGQVRCLPITSSQCSPGQKCTQAFVDAACHKPVLMYTDSLDPPPYIAFVSAGPPSATCTAGSPDVVTGYAVGAVLQWGARAQAGTTTPFFAMVDGVCKPRVSLTVEEADAGVYQLDELPPSAFVAAKEYDAPKTQRLSARYHEGEDGSLQFWSLVDLQRGEPCNEFGTGKDVGTRCFPSEAATVGVYADAACTTRAAIRDVAGYCRPPKSAVDADGSFFEVGGELLSAFTENEDTGVTTSVSASSASATMWSIGAALPKTDLPALEIITDRSGPLAAPFMRAEGTRLGPSRGFGPFMNTQTNERCEVSGAFGDVLRCVPLTWGSNDAPRGKELVQMDAYGDEGCTEPIVWWSGKTPTPNPYVFDGSRFAYRVKRRLGAGAVYRNLTSRPCVRINAGSITGDGFLVLDKTVDVATLPKITRVTE